MTIKELKELLDQYDENMTVRVFDSYSGNIDITEVYKAESVKRCPVSRDTCKVEYICIVQRLTLLIRNLYQRYGAPQGNLWRASLYRLPARQPPRRAAFYIC